MAKSGYKTKVTRKNQSSVKRNRIKDVLKSTAYILVGIPSDAIPYPDGTPVARVGFQNEYGIGVPERSFMRSTLKDNNSKYKQLMEKAIVDAIKGKRKIKQSLGRIGNKVSSDIKQKIVAIQSPANAESTIAAKGSSNPLIDSGHMKNSVTYEVVT